jgi:hypothetical protein
MSACASTARPTSAISRRRLDHIIDRLKSTSDIMRGMPAEKGVIGFTGANVANLRRIISRLEGAAQELVNAGY